MKIHVLVDNLAGRECGAEWGFSYFIEGKTNILFDFGSSDLFLKNSKKLDIDISKVEYTVLSHGHWDHGNGLKYLPENKKVICHPEVFMKRYSKNGYIGLDLDYEIASKKWNFVFSSEPIKIDEDTYYLGEIPRLNDFESKKTPFTKEDDSKDFVLDDSAIAIKTPKGLVVISGCAHSGICNTVEHAKKVTQETNVYAVLGGFHLQKNDAVTQKTIEYLKKLNVCKVLPSHCTKFPALVEFHKHFNSNQIAAGDILEF